MRAPSTGRVRRVTSGRRKLVVRALVVLGLAIPAGWALYARARGPHVPTLCASRSDVIETVVASGRVMPLARVDLGPVVLGTVRAVHVSEGDRVEAGALLVELDDREARAAVDRAMASVRGARAGAGRVRTLSSRVAGSDLTSAEAALARAEADLTRQEDLIARGATTRAELDTAGIAVTQARAALDAARARSEGAARGGSEARGAAASLAEAEADLAGAEARLSYHRIVAPSAGVVTTRAAEPGAVVQPGAVLVTLALDGPVRLRIEPDESTLATVRIAQPALASAEAFPDERFDATVSFVAPAVDPLRGTVEVRLEVATPPAYLRTDMTVSVEIEVARRAGVLALPATAVHDVGTAAPWVLALEGDRVRRVDVTLGAIGGDVVEITGGIDEGARLVPASAVGIEPGMRVRADAP